MNHRILFISPSDYEDLEKKGVTHLLADREENGFFERVITVHPAAKHARTIDLSPVHRLYEIHEYFLPGTAGFAPLRYLQHVFHLIRVTCRLICIIDEEKIHCLRVTDPVFSGLLARCLLLFRPLPFCVSIHADYAKRYELDGPRGSLTLLGSRRLAVQVEKWVLSRADQVMPIRSSLADSVKSMGIPETKIRVIPHGIDMTPFRKKTSFALRTHLALDGTPILSFVGRLSKENYVYDILEMASQLRDSHTNFQIVFAGDGPEREEITRLVHQNNLEPHVRLVGYQPREVVVALRQESTLSLCLMGGYSLIEACAAGHPVISYDVEWHSELAKTQETGWLVPEKNIPALVEAVSYLLDHPIESARMGAAAQALAFERHDIYKTSALKRVFYRELLGESVPTI